MNICIIGAGAWGTAMALHLNRCGHGVTLVPRRLEHALSLSSSRENSDYLPEYRLPHAIQIGSELAPVLMEAEVVLLACPSKGLREVCLKIANNIESAQKLKLFVVMCKGLELESLKGPCEVVDEFFPEIACGVLSGPTYAGEVAAGLPTAITFAMDGDFVDAHRYQEAFSNPALRIYLSDDVKGTELGGILKNVYAIAAGLCDGLKLGDNAKAALLTRSLNEMVVIGEKLGGQSATFYGLSGFGDLVATCSGEWSRNRIFGQRLGQGEVPETMVSQQKSVVEGYRATRCLKQLCDKENIEAPILSQIYSICYEGSNPLNALQALMNRDLKPE